jgi:hypothetical protein
MMILRTSHDRAFRTLAIHISLNSRFQKSGYFFLFELFIFPRRMNYDVGLRNFVHIFRQKGLRVGLSNKIYVNNMREYVILAESIRITSTELSMFWVIPINILFFLQFLTEVLTWRRFREK